MGARSAASLLSMLEPVLNPIWVFLGIGERPSPWALAGGAVVLGAVTVRTLLGRSGRDAEEVNLWTRTGTQRG